MQLRSRKRADPEVNMTSLIDVVLTLVLFFMVSTTFNRNSEIQLQLPEANAEKAESDRVQIDITIDAQGRYFVNEQEVINSQLETLKRAISKEAGERPNPIVVLSADKQTPHQAVITAMDAARQLGLVHLTFATTGSTEGP